MSITSSCGARPQLPTARPVDYLALETASNAAASLIRMWEVNTTHCSICEAKFSMLWRLRHHCRSCGLCVCSDCSRIQFVNSCLLRRERICTTCQTADATTATSLTASIAATSHSCVVIRASSVPDFRDDNNGSTGASTGVPSVIPETEVDLSISQPEAPQGARRSATSSASSSASDSSSTSSYSSSSSSRSATSIPHGFAQLRRSRSAPEMLNRV
mmetsp:Transcript_158170/g.279222  ORF Transcript_158170/g.279222 Transcript_158170/m.279222 type:complete len:216 (-) Transcript_158170:84-731(-)